MNRRPVSILGLFVLVTALSGDEPKQRTFGPEWKLDGDVYRKKAEIEVSHYATGNVSMYTIPLGKNRLSANEDDEGRHAECAITLTEKSAARLSIYRDQKNKSIQIFCSNGGVKYFDFNGDGIFDAYYDGRNGANKFMIRVGDTYVPVQDRKAGFGPGSDNSPVADQKSPDGRTEYTFENDKWAEK